MRLGCWMEVKVLEGSSSGLSVETSHSLGLPFLSDHIPGHDQRASLNLQNTAEGLCPEHAHPLHAAHDYTPPTLGVDAALPQEQHSNAKADCRSVVICVQLLGRREWELVDPPCLKYFLHVTCT